MGKDLERLPFIPGQIYNRRRDIHAIYGGNQQGGIAPSASHPFIFIFTGNSGQQHGYQDGWENKYVFSYTGEGQKGDMTFTRGNLALLRHKENGRRVFLFEAAGRGHVKFNCEVELNDFGDFDTIDTNGEYRNGIKFFFNRVGVPAPVDLKGLQLPDSIMADSEVPYVLGEQINTERTGLVTSRVGQGAYRKQVILRWNYKCAVTEFDRLEVLVASHILPWAESTHDQRLDPDNGILLSPTYDALFDRHLITFENSGKIILCDKIDPQAFLKIGVTGQESIHSLSNYNHPYLEKHRAKFGETH